MDAPLSAPEMLIRPWRTATLVASLVAAIELVLLLIAAVLLLAKPLVPRDAASCPGGRLRHAEEGRQASCRTSSRYVGETEADAREDERRGC